MMASTSVVFVSQHQDLIRRCTASVRAAAVFFLHTAAPKVLPPAIIVHLESILEQDPQRFTNLLRGHAVAFGEARQSTLFWDLVDACNFLIDATDDRWPYITDEGRLIRLGWAEQGANMVSHTPLRAI